MNKDDRMVKKWLEKSSVPSSLRMNAVSSCVEVQSYIGTKYPLFPVSVPSECHPKSGTGSCSYGGKKTKRLRGLGFHLGDCPKEPGAVPVT